MMALKEVAIFFHPRGLQISNITSSETYFAFPSFWDLQVCTRILLTKGGLRGWVTLHILSFRDFFASMVWLSGEGHQDWKEQQNYTGTILILFVAMVMQVYNICFPCEYSHPWQETAGLIVMVSLYLCGYVQFRSTWCCMFRLIKFYLNKPPN